MKRAICFCLMLLFLMTAAAHAEMLLPADLKVIESEAFAGDPSIATVRAPEGVTEIQARAFAGSGVTALYLPESLTVIDEHAFDDCPSGLTVYGPAGTAAAAFCKAHGIRYITPGMGLVGVSMPTDMFTRWKNDGIRVRDELEAAGCTVDLRYANNSADTQKAQIADMISEGCRVLIIAPIWSDALTEELNTARENGIAIISYDRLLTNTDAVTRYITFDNVGIGRLQAQFICDRLSLASAETPCTLEITTGDTRDTNAHQFFDGAMSVLQPYIDAGKLVVRSGQTAFDDCATESWNPDNAKTRATAILAANYPAGENIDAWLCSNDSTALGVTEALQMSYTGRWPIVTGQDCDVENVRLIKRGKQAMSVFKDTLEEAKQAAKMATQFFRGVLMDVNDTESFYNGAITVQSYLVAPTYVDASNYWAMLVESGIYPAEYFE